MTLDYLSRGIIAVAHGKGWTGRMVQQYAAPEYLGRYLMSMASTIGMDGAADLLVSRYGHWLRVCPPDKGRCAYQSHHVPIAQAAWERVYSDYMTRDWQQAAAWDIEQALIYRPISTWRDVWGTDLYEHRFGQFLYILNPADNLIVQCQMARMSASDGSVTNIGWREVARINPDDYTTLEDDSFMNAYLYIDDEVAS